ASLTALCFSQDKIRISSICKLFNIRVSTIQFQVKQKILETFNIDGFVSLVKSSDILNNFLKKIGAFGRVMLKRMKRIRKLIYIKSI
ncbi:MAG: hypothetical protein ACXAAH_16580, partial [Promethearchaeota archaeon]